MVEMVPCHVCLESQKSRRRQASAVVMNQLGMRIALCADHAHEFKLLDEMNGQVGNVYRRLYPGERFKPQLMPSTLPRIG